MTGPQAANGVDNRDGVLLAIKEINAKGVKIDGKPVVFELDINDDGADPKQGVQIAQSLSDKKIKFVMGPYNSGVTMPAARVLNDSDIVVLTVASNPKITEMGYNNLFRIGATCHWTQFGTANCLARQVVGHQAQRYEFPAPTSWPCVCCQCVEFLHVAPVAYTRCHLAPVRYSVLGDLSPLLVVCCCARLFLLSAFLVCY